MKVETIQEELATLPPDAQKIIFDLVMILKNATIQSQKNLYLIT